MRTKVVHNIITLSKQKYTLDEIILLKDKDGLYKSLTDYSGDVVKIVDRVYEIIRDGSICIEHDSPCHKGMGVFEYVGPIEIHVVSQAQ